jgi:hypothetical protein
MALAPVTILIILLAGLAAQAVPGFGLLVMVFTMTWWSPLLINLFMVAVVAAVMRGDWPRPALLLPLAFYLGFAAVAVGSRLEFRRVDQDYRRFNTGAMLTFNPRTDTLGFEGDQDTPRAIPQLYDIAVAYSTPSGGRVETAIMFRPAAEPECAQIRQDARYFAAHIHAYGISGPSGLLPGVCMVQGHAGYITPTVTVRATHADGGSWLLPIKAQVLTVSHRDGRAIQLKTGYAAPIQWWPLPMVGCYWWRKFECSAGFLRTEMRGLGAEGAYGGANTHVVAAALGLRRATIEDLRGKPRSGADAVSAANSAVIGRINESVGNLDALLSGRRRSIIIHDVTALETSPELIAARANQIVSAMPGLLAAGNSGEHESARVLQQLLAALPADQFRPVGTAVIDLLMRQQNRTSTMVGPQFLLRSSDLGAHALPLLRWAAMDRARGADPSAILALCRIGPAAADTASGLAEALSISPNDTFRDRRKAAILALRRIGRADLLALDPHADNAIARRFASETSSISSATPPDACKLR